jgi:hypothetical protein
MLATATPAQRAASMAEQRAKDQKAIAERKKGSDKTGRMCPLKQDVAWTSIATGGSAPCTKQLSTSAQQINLHVVCKGDDGKPGQAQTNHFSRIDAEHFEGTVALVSGMPMMGTITQTYTGKWIGESCSGPAAGYAAKNGLHPQGAENVARDDPNRVVAAFDGKDMTAQQAWNILKKVPPTTRSTYKTGTTGLLERVYLQMSVADEAAKLHLDKQEPWKSKLAHAKQVDLQVAQDYEGDPHVPPEVWARWIGDQQRILWNAYFAQAATQSDKDALLAKEKALHKITVKDPDFFK